MRYKILRSGDIKELEKKVNKRIRKGWRPKGGVSVCGGYGHAHFHQTMLLQHDPIKEEEE
jgi:hypothetical protein